VNLYDGNQGLPHHRRPLNLHRLRPHFLWPRKLMRRQDPFLSLRNPLRKAYFTPSALLESHTAKRVSVDSRILRPTVGVVCAASTALPMEVVVPRHIRLPRHLHLCLLLFPTSPLRYFRRQPLATAVQSYIGYSPTPDNHCPISSFPDTLALDALPNPRFQPHMPAIFTDQWKR